MSWPLDPIAAVTHPDPWPYYADLRTRSMHVDRRIDMWVAASPGDVDAVLTHPDARVRPGPEPVPSHLVGRPAGSAFAAWARMTDGPSHGPRRRAMESLLESLSPDKIAAACEVAATAIGDAPPARWMSAYPTAVVAHLLGLPMPLDDVVLAAAALAACFGPAGGPADVEAAEAAIRALPPAAVTLFFQAFDATAGLIGAAISGGDQPPVHNTRRYFDVDARLAGCDVRAGDRVLVVLAAADLPFGEGAHRCPARSLAIAIADHAAAHLGRACHPTGHRPSPNVRIPTFT